MQVFTEAYTELCNHIGSKIPEIKWMDLWHNQVGFLQSEHPFPCPAIFLSFRTTGNNDLGQKVQDGNVQIDVYLYFETFSDTFKGSFNQQSALNFLKILDKIHKHLHGFSGTNMSEMRDIATRPGDTGSAGNLYVKSFTCNMRDYEAMTETEPVSEYENPEDEPFFTL